MEAVLEVRPGVHAEAARQFENRHRIINTASARHMRAVGRKSRRRPARSLKRAATSRFATCLPPMSFQADPSPRSTGTEGSQLEFRGVRFAVQNCERKRNVGGPLLCTGRTINSWYRFRDQVREIPGLRSKPFSFPGVSESANVLFDRAAASETAVTAFRAIEHVSARSLAEYVDLKSGRPSPKRLAEDPMQVHAKDFRNESKILMVEILVEVLKALALATQIMNRNRTNYYRQLASGPPYHFCPRGPTQRQSNTGLWAQKRRNLRLHFMARRTYSGPYPKRGIHGLVGHPAKSLLFAFQAIYDGVVAQRERKVGQLGSNFTLEDGILVVSNALTQFQVISEDEWITIEVARVCRSGSSRDDLEGSKRRENFVFTLARAERGESNLVAHLNILRRLLCCFKGNILANLSEIHLAMPRVQDDIQLRERVSILEKGMQSIIEGRPLWANQPRAHDNVLVLRLDCARLIPSTTYLDFLYQVIRSLIALSNDEQSMIRRDMATLLPLVATTGLADGEGSAYAVTCLAAVINPTTAIGLYSHMIAFYIAAYMIWRVIFKVVSSIPCAPGFDTKSTILLIDILGLEIRLPLKRCATFEASFSTLLTEHVSKQRNGSLAQYVHSRAHELTDMRNSAVVYPRVWVRKIRAGMKLDMAVLLHLPFVACPWCGREDREALWIHCGGRGGLTVEGKLWTDDGAYKPPPAGHEFPPDLCNYPPFEPVG
ncbi:hypothetical protein DFH09DRAFT_1083951 [Mycena vulgaris]|nr:hypothetical protein DFH09DRAFT_1083951 [Mycena vulgaris]